MDHYYCTSGTPQAISAVNIQFTVLAIDIPLSGRMSAAYIQVIGPVDKLKPIRKTATRMIWIVSAIVPL